MKFEEVRELLLDVSYKDGWSWRLEPGDYGRSWLSYEFEANGEVQRTRAWLIEPEMSKSDIVRTALKCVLTAEEHEAREAFRYRNARIFGPHLDVDVLSHVARQKANLDIREGIDVSDETREIARRVPTAVVPRVGGT